MNKKQLLEEVLAMLSTFREDKHKLQKVHTFMMNEVYEEPEQEDIPKKYKKVVHEIADSLLAGLICFFNPDTLEVEYIPKEWMDDPEEYEAMTGERLESEERKYESWEKCIEIAPMNSNESFKVMESFIDELGNQIIQNQLISALNNRKPFANFKSIVESSAYRQQWFDFREQKWEQYVWNLIEPANSPSQ